MFRRFSVNLAILSIVVDGTFVALALWFAAHIRPVLNRVDWFADLPSSFAIPWYLYLVFSAVWVLVFLFSSLYDGRRNFRFVDELTALITGSLLASAVLAGILYFSFRELSRALFILFLLLAFLLVLVWRIGARVIFRRGIKGSFGQRRVLIVGAGQVGRGLQAQIEKSENLGLHLVGFLDDDPEKSSKHKDILGSLAEAKLAVAEWHIQDVVLALPNRAYQKIDKLVTELHELPVNIWLIPDYSHLALHKMTIGEYAGIPMLDLRAPALDDYQRMIKRMFDIFICILLIPFLLPLFGILAMAIWVDDPGPVFFRQLRVGENRRSFKVFKFRSMVVNAEALRHTVEKVDENGNLIHKTRDDPRITRVGRFLRRFSLDELPQLFNVLRGEMSLVGPRPELPYLVEDYKPWQEARFAVPQGMTGWWQVNGRSDKPMHLNTEDDIYYVQNYSIWLDIQIVIKTVFMVLRGRGAY